ncbi:type A2 lantipeptide [Streptomyces sp. RPT161]|uniref:type A2 lantipeptide n=1 Tax=Streptomyces sp. RPT161 TaxID=3015993 RepID=UPI0022B89288|nr:type A2 lantipeptide [Streptomyces sp. RPT161]
MRNDFTPVETQEISDADLDAVSGGLLGGLVQEATSALPVLPGLPSGVISGGAGIQVVGPVSGQASVSGIAGL